MTRVLITRPSPEAERWVEQLQAQNIDAVALPLLAIGAVRDPQLQAALREARARLHDFRALMFVSGNAATEFLADGPADALRLPGRALPRFWSPGPGTARALVKAGVPATQIDGPPADAGQFDSESLWHAVHGQIGTGDRVLVVRGANAAQTQGGNGRDWLAAQITGQGGAVEFVAAYERRGAVLDAAAKDLAQRAASDGTLWFFSSSEAINNLTQELPNTRWHKARALVTHPRIAEAARAAGFGDISECRPTLQEVTASIKSLP
ncbi:hypothetical protein SDC9_109604 [bioreactor metagenome]|uniref:uroporphyrinogen-III synthase n=1 Tax=bioreactor metagenome TaxID=1076179 RepID=A0A645BBN0_9ZZZZ